MDNFKTHSAGSLYEVFSPSEAKKDMGQIRFIYTPKHGSWLNMAEKELNVLNGQCLSKHIDAIEKVRSASAAWHPIEITRTKK